MTKSKSQEFIENKNRTPVVTPSMYKAVSEVRREMLAGEVENGLYSDGGAKISEDMQRTPASNVIGGFNKKASGIVGSGTNTSAGWRGNGGTDRQVQSIYSPLWLNTNLNLPRDRATINAWCRSFFALNPVVNNAINLHSTYPISKLNIKCSNKKVEKFFNEMIEEIDLMNICVQVAQEFWLLGEAFIYAELDERSAKWSRLVIQNPDYIVVKKGVVASEPIIMLRPDENLRRIVFSNRAADIEQRKQLNDNIIQHVRKGENIPLDNFYISHLARRIAPYEVRGTGLPVNSFRLLMIFDLIREAKFQQTQSFINPLTLVKIGSADYKPTLADIEVWREQFECYDEETEVLTDQGFKKFDEIIEFSENKEKSRYVSNPKKDIKIACFNENNEQLEYYNANKSFIKDYDGEMHHYSNKKIDVKVTPNHDLWVSEMKYEYNGGREYRKIYWENFVKIKSQDLLSNNSYRFRSQLNWEGKNIDYVDILNKKVPIKLYLEFLGYVLSEGCLYTNNKFQYTVGICQTFKKYQKEMSLCVNKMAGILGKNAITQICNKNGSQYVWSGSLSGKEFYNFIKSEIGDGLGRVKTSFKQIPRWIFDLDKELLQILLNALVKGDGSIKKSKNYTSFSYYSTSKQLADDVYEIAYKCGYVPTAFCRNNEKYTKRNKNSRLPLYTVSWSNSNHGNFPLVSKVVRNGSKTKKAQILNKEHYNGKVWCLTVPTGLFITRRNGKITVQGNCAQNDLDYKIFTHEAVTVERVGANSAIMDTSGDITQLLKEIYIGLMVPQVIIEGGGDITYANGGVSLEVLNQRYMAFREMISNWLRRKIFAPISKLNEFYEYENGEKKLIIPQIDWNHMNLFDASDYINVLQNLSTGEQKRISTQTLYRSLGLEFEEERRKIRKEDVAEAIRKKEIATLDKMPLNELRALSDDSEIPEIAPAALPGESPYAGPEDEAQFGGSLPGTDTLGGSPLPGTGPAPDLGSLPGSSGPELGASAVPSGSSKP